MSMVKGVKSLFMKTKARWAPGQFILDSTQASARAIYLGQRLGERRG
jgi:hypothetical protein